MSEAKLRRYEGGKAVVTWDEGVCRHAGECVRALPGVFDPKARPWIAPDAASVDALKAAIARCPSGALKLYAKDGTLLVANGAAQAAGEATRLTLRPNGPYIFAGDIVVALPTPKSEARAVLCRCGRSGNKPFCDGTHNKIGFQAPDTLPSDAPPGSAPAGRVTITPTENGPLHCIGPLTLTSSDGRTSATEETWLCRCGGSSTKPFCDGTHEKNGFRG